MTFDVESISQKIEKLTKKVGGAEKKRLSLFNRKYGSPPLFPLIR